MAKRYLAKKINPVQVMADVYLSNLEIDGAEPYKVANGFMSISELGKIQTIWSTLGTHNCKTKGSYTVEHALSVINRFMVLEDFIKINQISLDRQSWKSPLVIGISTKGKQIILDGNHRACAFWQLFRDKKEEFLIPVIFFYFRIRKEN